MDAGKLFEGRLGLSGAVTDLLVVGVGLGVPDLVYEVLDKKSRPCTIKL